MDRCPQLDGSSSSSGFAGASASQENFLQCPKCPQVRLFKRNRGLKIHFSRKHPKNDHLISHSCNPSSNYTIIPPSHPITSLSQSDKSFWEKISELKKNVPVLKRIPRGARIAALQSLSNLIKNVIVQNSVSAWERLLLFPYRILHIRPNRNIKTTITQTIKDNCSNNTYISSNDLNSDSFILSTKKSHSETTFFRKVETRLGDGDIRGAAKLLFSTDVALHLIPPILCKLSKVNTQIRHQTYFFLNLPALNKP